MVRRALRLALLAVVALAASALGVPALFGAVVRDAPSAPQLTAAVAKRLVARANLARPAIVGGTTADDGEYPWAAHVVIVLPDGPDPDTDVDLGGTCGGSLIGEQWVLSAAHCFLPENGGPAPLGAIVVIGQNDISNPPDKSFHISAERFTLGYDPATDANDLVLLRLLRPAPEEGILLAGEDDDALWAPGTLSTIVGWGDTAENGQPSDVLLEAHVPIVDDATCGSLLAPIFNRQTMLCAGVPQGGVDACQGDSGGPLMVPDGFGGLIQAGIVSGGFGCARPNSPGIYTRLAKYTAPVVSLLKGDPEAPVGDPAATTGAAGKITKSSARLSGTIRANGLAADALLEIGKTKKYGRLVEGYADSGFDDKPISFTFKGLKKNTLYHYRADVWTAAGFFRGFDRTFKTKGK